MLQLHATHRSHTASRAKAPSDLPIGSLARAAAAAARGCDNQRQGTAGRGHMDGSSEDNGYSGLFYFMLTIGIIGIIGFVMVCGSIQ